MASLADGDRRVIDALRRPLELAAADNFRGVARISGLGAALRALVDAVLQRFPEHEAMAAWRVRLDDFDHATTTDQEVEVARGMRLVAQLCAAAPTAAAKPKLSRPGRVAVAVPESAPPSTKKSRAAKATVTPLSLAAVDPLAESPRIIKGIGPAFATALAERGITTVEDLLLLVPRRYDDARQATELSAIVSSTVDGDRVVVRATVRRARMMFVRGRRWCDARFEESGCPDELVVRWFGIRGPMDQRLPVGAVVVLSGKRKDRGGVIEMANPDIISIEIPGQPRTGSAPGLLPRYPDIPGLPAARLRTACAAACAQFADIVDDGVPSRVLTEVGLTPLGLALRTLHAPPSDLSDDEVAALHAGTSPWQRRIAFGELFVLGAAVARRRRERQGDKADIFARHPRAVEDLASALPFTLTLAQQRCLAEISEDLAQPSPMNRLLQGDVGSGKTAVMFGAALQVARGGGQVAIMAPTELLAEQHERTLSVWARGLGLRCALLTASTPRGTRASLLAMLAAGQLDLVVGTHALLAEGVQFGKLGLVVIDEQHRFGVAQRVRLRHKGAAGEPHLLVVTATPIPRTLALTAYGDLDVSTLDELPPGRLAPTTTMLVGAKGRSKAVAAVSAAIARGERAYVVCPLVEPAVDSDGARIAKRDATTTASELAAALAPVQVALVHGRLDGKLRDSAMTAFRHGEAQVLVATTVIEVGVDVPEATLMMIEDADHFGLAQLHQLRGRIGRGGGPSSCLLVTTGSNTEYGAQRLAAMVETSDGFRIAERDLELRGPGELLGARQAGLPQLRFGDIAQHTELLLVARAAADRVLERDPHLAHPEQRCLVAALRRRGAAGVFGAEGG